MEKQRRWIAVLDFLRDALVFAEANLRHYALALLGFRLRLDPDYPIVRHFFPSLIADTVFEYRTYALIAPWCVIWAFWLPKPWAVALMCLWAVQTAIRARYYSSNYVFWKQAFEESPDKMRVKTRYAEQMILQMELLIKETATARPDDGEWKELSVECERLINDIAEKRRQRGPGESIVWKDGEA